MKFSDNAFVLSVRRHAETTGIVKVFSLHHGTIAGAVRGIAGKRARGVWQTGNGVSVIWQARLAEQLGTLTGELTLPVAARAMARADTLAALATAAALIELTMPEHAAHPALYERLEELARALAAGAAWHEAYARFELALLAEGGFRLDLSACAATGDTQELIYVSPKSGRAVSRRAGEPYKDKLLPLPEFLLSPSPHDSAFASGSALPAPPPGGSKNEKALPLQGGGLGGGEIPETEILASLQLTGYFLEHWLLAPHGRKLPASRHRLIESLA